MSRTVELKKTAHMRELIAHSLSQAMSVHQMVKLVHRVIPDYDLYQRSGFPESIPIPQMDAASRIAEDVDQDGFLIRFVEELIEVQRNGVMGRKVRFRLLPQIVAELKSLGMVYREEYGIFVEDRRKTKGWGVLREGSQYEFSFLRADVVSNTALVRRHTAAQVSLVYADLRDLVQQIVEKRDGRIWNWEGDGGVVAFYFGAKNVMAALCGIEILLEVFLYNRLRNPLSESLSIRLAVHTGQAQFLSQTGQITSEALQRLETLEADQTEADSLTLSPVVYTNLGSKLSALFQAAQADDHSTVYRYRLRWK
jgi:class 3 adenylate cyclase